MQAINSEDIVFPVIPVASISLFFARLVIVMVVSILMSLPLRYWCSVINTIFIVLELKFFNGDQFPFIHD